MKFYPKKTLKKATSPITNMFKRDFDDVPLFIEAAKNRKKNNISNVKKTLKTSMISLAFLSMVFIYSYIQKDIKAAILFGSLLVLGVILVAVLYIKSSVNGDFEKMEEVNSNTELESDDKPEDSVCE